MPTPTSSGDTAPVAVAVEQNDEAPGQMILEAALEASGFWAVLRRRRKSRRKRKRDLTIAIKPDLDAFEADDPRVTDPALVEWLVTLLHRNGYATVALCDGRNRADAWLHNRDALCVPDLLGYRFEDADGEPYDFVWVDDAPEAVPIHKGDQSASLLMNGTWAQADVRISFAKAKTDEHWGYALTVSNLLGLVSGDGPSAHWGPAERALYVLRTRPPHMALIDAVVGSHGNAGSRVARPLRTGSVVASPNALLADWAGALKMGADPYASPINAMPLERVGLPDDWTLVGDVGTWPGWKNPAPTLIEAVRARERWPGLDSLADAVLQPVDRELFPFRDILIDQLSATVLGQLEKIGESRVGEGVGALLAQLLALLAAARSAYVYNFAKGQIIRSVAPLTLDVDQISPSEFDGTERIVRAQARVLTGTEGDARGFRFRTIDGHIHFAASRVLALPFDDFVQRVAISASIRYMNDYLGGSWIVTDADDQGRPSRQAERNIYLPQPNWTGAFGGEPIDVEKIERISYGEDRQDIWWRTLVSSNGSADSDDGSVAFIRTPADEVEVRIFARQRFRLPPTLAAARVERWPGVHRELASDAYLRFFEGTLSNLRSQYEGLPYRIGKAADGEEQVGSDARAFVSSALGVLSKVLGWAPSTAERDDGSADWTGAEPLLVDDHGFVHFPGVDVPTVVGAGRSAAGPGAGREPLTAATFLTELGRAVGRDLGAAGVSGLELLSRPQGEPGQGAIASGPVEDGAAQGDFS